MKRIRCCLLNKKSVYRGIDREVDMHIFNGEKNSTAYETAFNLYLRYLSTEEEYTSENLNIISSFSDFINRHYGNSEIILYDTHPIDSNDLCIFLGVDIVDMHLESVIKNKKTLKYKCCTTNQYDLYYNHSDASAVIQCMQEKNTKFLDLYYIYVYQIVNQ